MELKYREFTGLNLPAIEQEVLAAWTAGQAFEKSVSLREGATLSYFTKDLQALMGCRAFTTLFRAR